MIGRLVDLVVYELVGGLVDRLVLEDMGLASHQREEQAPRRPL